MMFAQQELHQQQQLQLKDKTLCSDVVVQKERAHGAGDKTSTSHQKHHVHPHSHHHQHHHHRRSGSTTSLINMAHKPSSKRSHKQPLVKYPMVKDLTSFNELEFVERMIDDMNQRESSKRKSRTVPKSDTNWFLTNHKQRHKKIKNTSQKEVLPMKVRSDKQTRKSIFAYSSPSLVITKNSMIEKTGTHEEKVIVTKQSSLEKFNTRPKRKHRKLKLDEKKDTPSDLKKKVKTREIQECSTHGIKTKGFSKIHHHSKPWRNIFKQEKAPSKTEPPASYPTILWQSDMHEQKNAIISVKETQTVEREKAGFALLGRPSVDKFSAVIYKENRRKRLCSDTGKIPPPRKKLRLNDEKIKVNKTGKPREKLSRESKQRVRETIDDFLNYLKDFNNLKKPPKKSLIPVPASMRGKSYPRVLQTPRELRSESDMLRWGAGKSYPSVHSESSYPPATPERKSFLPRTFRFCNKMFSRNREKNITYYCCSSDSVNTNNECGDINRPYIQLRSHGFQVGDALIKHTKKLVAKKHDDKGCEVRIPIDTRGTQVSHDLIKPGKLSRKMQKSVEEIWKSRSLHAISSVPSLITKETQTSSSFCILRAIKSLVRRSRNKKNVDHENVCKTLSELKDTRVGELLTTCNYVQTDQLLDAITKSITDTREENTPPPSVPGLISREMNTISYKTQEINTTSTIAFKPHQISHEINTTPSQSLKALNQISHEVSTIPPSTNHNIQPFNLNQISREVNTTPIPSSHTHQPLKSNQISREVNTSITNFASYFCPDDIDSVAAELDSKDSKEILRDFLLDSNSNATSVSDVNRNEIDTITDAIKRLEARINQRRCDNSGSNNGREVASPVMEKPKKDRKGILRLLIGRKKPIDNIVQEKAAGGDDISNLVKLKVSVTNPKEERFNTLFNKFNQCQDKPDAYCHRNTSKMEREREQLADVTEIKHCFKSNFEPGCNENKMVSVDVEAYDFLINLGVSMNEAIVVLKNECIKANLETALFECRIGGKSEVTRDQGILLYLLSLKACRSAMLYYLQLVDAVSHCKIVEPRQLDSFLQFLNEHCKNDSH